MRMEARFLSRHTGMFAGMLGVLAAICATATSGAAPTPLTEKIPEAKEVLIRCELAKASKKPTRTGRSIVNFKDGEYSYKLWVPKGYEADPKRRWPCVFIASPVGKAGMGPMGGHLKKSGYIVVMLQESRNGDDAPCNSNFVAAHDDVVARLRIAEGQKYATGLSGAARGASFNALLRPGFAGVFQQAAGFLTNDTGFPRQNFCLVTSIGNKDYNIREYPSIAFLCRVGKVSWFPLTSDTGHTWSPGPLAEKAFLIMEWHTLTNAPLSPDLRATAKTWLVRHPEIIRKMPAIADKILFADRTLKVATKFGLQSDPALVSLRTELAQWQKDPAAAKELAAETAFQKAFEKDINAWNPYALDSKGRMFYTAKSGDKARNKARELESVIKRHPDTEGGNRAKQFVESMKSPPSVPKS